MSRGFAAGLIIVAVSIAVGIGVNIPHHHAGLALPAHCSYRGGGVLPDPACTPGSVNRHVTQSDISKTICVRGWTSTIRPPVSYTEPLKHKLLASYGQPDQPWLYELDHYIPLELGGNPTAVSNLWPEPHASSFQKDLVENRLRQEVCDRMLTLAAARHIIRTDWRQG